MQLKYLDNVFIQQMNINIGRKCETIRYRNIQTKSKRTMNKTRKNSATPGLIMMSEVTHFVK